MATSDKQAKMIKDLVDEYRPLEQCFSFIGRNIDLYYDISYSSEKGEFIPATPITLLLGWDDPALAAPAAVRLADMHLNWLEDEEGLRRLTINFTPTIWFTNTCACCETLAIDFSFYNKKGEVVEKFPIPMFIAYCNSVEPFPFQFNALKNLPKIATRLGISAGGGSWHHC